MEECNVCYSTKNQKIKCKECQYEACSLCVHTYLLGITNDPHCMNCRCSWDILFLRKNLGPEFMDGPFKRQKMNILWKRFSTLSHMGKNVLCPCPSCPCGKIIQPTLTCSSCWSKVCGKCFCPQETTHMCQEEDVRSWEKIAETTRNCPGCSVPIEKKSGCFQMFCTHCYTAFDWKDGSILEKKDIHNPHYFDHHQHRGMLQSFQEKMSSVRDSHQKRKYTEFYSLMREIEAQIPPQPPCITDSCWEEQQLYDQEEARQRELCKYLLWVQYYKRGLLLMREFFSGSSELICYKIQCFQNDLRDVLIDYNEHVAECLLLRGYRLFPSHSNIVCQG